MSRAQLERIVADFDLYESERETKTLDDVIGQLRKVSASTS